MFLVYTVDKIFHVYRNFAHYSKTSTKNITFPTINRKIQSRYSKSHFQKFTSIPVQYLPHFISPFPPGFFILFLSLLLSQDFWSTATLAQPQGGGFSFRRLRRSWKVQVLNQRLLRARARPLHARAPTAFRERRERGREREREARAVFPPSLHARSCFSYFSFERDESTRVSHLQRRCAGAVNRGGSRWGGVAVRKDAVLPTVVTELSTPGRRISIIDLYRCGVSFGWGRVERFVLFTWGGKISDTTIVVTCLC